MKTLYTPGLSGGMLYIIPPDSPGVYIIYGITIDNNIIYGITRLLFVEVGLKNLTNKHGLATPELVYSLFL